MPINRKSFLSKEYFLEYTAISGYFPDIAVIVVNIGIFYE